MKHNMIRLMAAAMLAVMLTLSVVGMIGCKDKTPSFSYMEDDIASMITFHKDKFDALSVSVDAKHEITDEKIEEYIRKALFGKKTLVNGGKNEVTGTIGEGDSVRLWYFGTVETAKLDDKGNPVKDENGNTVMETIDIRDNASDNIYNNAPMSSTLGADALRIEALEKAILGAKIEDYIAESEGTVKADAIYFLSYYYNDLNADGKTVKGDKIDGLIRVPASEMDTLLAPGFKAAFDKEVVGKTFDVAGNKFFKFAVDATEDTAFAEGAVKREYGIRVCGQTARDLEVEGAFADDGGVYAGDKVKLHVQLFNFVDYKIPTLEEAIDNLLSDSTIKDYKKDNELADDATLTSEQKEEAYRKQIKETLEQGTERVSAIQEAIWNEFKVCVTVNSLPEAKVKEMYNIFLKTVKDYWKEANSDDLKGQFTAEYGEAAMKDINTFAVAMLDGQAGQTAEQVVREKAESWVREDMIVFAIVRFSGLEMPDDATVKKEIDADIATIMKETKLTEQEIYDTYGGREYFMSSYYRNYILEELVEKVTVTYADPTPEEK